MIRRWLGLVMGLWAVAAPAVDNTENLNFDLGVKTALVLGSVAQDGVDADAPNTTVTTNINFGGMVLGVSANYDFTRWLTISVGVHFLIDLILLQITRKGVDVTAGFHLLGGARRTLTETDAMSIMERDPYAVTFLVRPGLQSYNPTTSGDSTNQVTASLLGVDMGAEYRMDLGERSSISLAFLYSVITFPASDKKVKAALMTFEASWRVFL